MDILQVLWGGGEGGFVGRGGAIRENPTGWHDAVVGKLGEGMD